MIMSEGWSKNIDIFIGLSNLIETTAGAVIFPFSSSDFIF